MLSAFNYSPQNQRRYDLNISFITADSCCQLFIILKNPCEADKDNKIYIANDTNEELDELTIKYIIMDKQNNPLHKGSFNASVAANGLFTSDKNILSIDEKMSAVVLELYKDNEIISTNRYER